MTGERCKGPGQAGRETNAGEMHERRRGLVEIGTHVVDQVGDLGAASGDGECCRRYQQHSPRCSAIAGGGSRALDVAEMAHRGDHGAECEQGSADDDADLLGRRRCAEHGLVRGEGNSEGCNREPDGADRRPPMEVRPRRLFRAVIDRRRRLIHVG